MSSTISGFENRRGRADRSRILRPGRKNNRVFYTAVVVNYISNPEYDLAQEAINEEDDPITLKESMLAGVHQVKNPDYIDRMPRNSIVARIVSGRASRVSGPEIFYPFFSPHLCMPVEAGEQVWIIFEEAGSKRSMGYWVCRRPSDLHVDDLNYTHQDRHTLDLAVAGTDESAQASFDGESDDPVDPFSFPLGGKGERQDNTLPGEDPYTDIITESASYQSEFIGEPVPRFSKKSTDLVFQGSNNTLISLGTDRTGPIHLPEGTEEDDKPQTSLAGTIDIVTGRGQDEATAAAATGTAVDRGYDEIDKAPTVSGNADESNVNEGDPDFTNDLSRVYVSMNTSGDANFGSSVGSGFSSDDDSGAGPYVVVKSTNPRIIARSDGSIKIVHEAGANIVMDASGNVQIQTAGTITMGKDGSTASSGGTTGIQPFVRGDDLASILQDFLTEVSAGFGGIGTAFLSNATPGYGAPNTVLTGQGQGLLDSSGALAELIGRLGEFKSTVVEGE